MINIYYTIYANVLLLVVFLSYLYSNISVLDAPKNFPVWNILGAFLAVFLGIYVGFRPIDYIFVDMPMYAHMFEMYADGSAFARDATTDVGFYYLMEYCSKIMTAEMFFFVCFMIYIVPLVFVSIKWFKKYWFYSFLLLVTSFSFLSYGVNGIRNGMATSVFLLAISFANQRIIMALILFVSYSFHKSMSLPILALCITFAYNDFRTYLKFWLISIPLSFAVGTLFITLFTSLGFNDDRVGTYLSDVETLESSGFRLDFIIYSASAIFAAWYYIVKKKFDDPFYTRLVNVYLIVNTFWILIIRAGFSNRFAYLSWFMIAIIIIYPLLKIKLITEQHKTIGKILVIYYIFTYVLNFIS
ncbi:hypothetical protein FNO01nite_10510 [Flavobacterium noncentrifugens]|uniref:EpsG family protein n=1 Tax=Flavobacterium noncentrifugens TaxID=1128970 RepID=A0A1G8V7P5_9FLAO|nr:EpsG family protein [Flavobacterium noncentrifugens]GEP50379.1 hypothetical protein FNO01nite_10510 [Flavobacterium noncentrifugens]SDJ62112.1 EpsG family protein [Flavobacterium noncentrifugens]